MRLRRRLLANAGSRRRPVGMRALTVIPGARGSARLEELPEPSVERGGLLVEMIAVGICGTDREILAGAYGRAPAGRERLVLGHESLGRVLKAPPGGEVREGDLVVGIVRRPDPVPCPACAGGEWDMCQNGEYTERGITGRDGYLAERVALDPAFAVKVDPELGMCGVLVEPASVLAKAWDHIERIGRRTRTWAPKSVLVTGAGPVGLIAALMATQRGFHLDVLDREAEGIKPRLVRELGGTYHTSVDAIGSLASDIVLECTGAPTVVREVLCRGGRNAIVCLTGVSSGGRSLGFDIGAFNRETVLENDVVFGSVNANRAHYEAGAKALARADRGWLRRLVTRTVPLERWPDALERRAGDVKVVVDFGLEI